MQGHKGSSLYVCYNKTVKTLCDILSFCAIVIFAEVCGMYQSSGPSTRSRTVGANDIVHILAFLIVRNVPPLSGSGAMGHTYSAYRPTHNKPEMGPSLPF